MIWGGPEQRPGLLTDLHTRGGGVCAAEEAEAGAVSVRHVRSSRSLGSEKVVLVKKVREVRSSAETGRMC